MENCKWEDKFIDKIEDNLVSYTYFYQRGFDRKYIPEALEKIGDSIERKDNCRSLKELDGENLFGKIDDVIKYLESLKAEGYEEIETDLDYCDVGAFAVKTGIEDSEHYYKRLAGMISPHIMEMRRNAKLMEKKEARIMELEKELEEIKNAMKGK